MPLSLYIHIPFCVRKCPYCDFVSYDDSNVPVEDYVEALSMEMGHFAPMVKDAAPIETIYIGGGTPSILEPAQIGKIIAQVEKKFGIALDAEVTLEVNPGTINAEKLKGYYSAGVNRLSIGVQSTNPQSLKTLGRIHAAEEARDAFKAARGAGFESVSIDLIFGLPGQSVAEWLEDLKQAISWKPDHVSAYMLKAPEGWETPDEDTLCTMYLRGVEILNENGLFQYEVSNFSMPGKESRHNNVYWCCGSYLGFGAAAHSHLVDRRWSNEASIPNYIECVKKEGNAIAVSENVTKDMALDEMIMLGLRLSAGIDLDALATRFGESTKTAIKRAACVIVEKGLGEFNGNRFNLNPRGMLLADEIAAEFAVRAAAKA